LLISQSTSEVDIYRAELSVDGAQAQSAVPVIVSSRYDSYPVYSPNGERIAFASLRSGEWQIWVCDKDGTNAIQLTTLKGGEARPTSWRPPDGRQIGFVHNGDGTMRAFMVATAGGIPQRVPELARLTSPVDFFWWSPNGSWVVYSTSDGVVWKIPTAGGTPDKLGIAGGGPAFDGASAIAVVARESGWGDWRIVPLDGGASRPLSLLGPLPGDRFRPNDSSEFLGSFATAHGPQGWYLAHNPTPTSPGGLIFYRLPSGPASQVSGAAAASGYGLSFSPNGRSLLYTKFVSTGADLMLVENFK
jgi:hypothetical protein